MKKDGWAYDFLGGKRGYTNLSKTKMMKYRRIANFIYIHEIF